MNALTGAGVLTEDRLFSTLDSTTRRYKLPNGRVLLLSDTVGFVRRLPHQLVEAFRSTLQETVEADLLIHVVDAAEPGASGQIAAVREVLQSIGAGHVPEVLVLNKADLAGNHSLTRLRRLYPAAVTVSSTEGTGLDRLADCLADRLAKDSRQVELLVPYTHGELVGRLRSEGEVLSQQHRADGTFINVRLPKDSAHRYREFQVISGGTGQVRD